MGTLSDEDIVVFLRSEFNPKLFSLLIERHRSSIIKKCQGYVKTRDEAEDLSQDILIKIYLQLHTFKKDSKFTTWLYSIIHNQCIDYLRRNRKNLHEQITDRLSDEVGELIDFDQEPPEDLTEEILTDLLDQISPEGKLILLLKYKEKKSLKEIQTALNLNESAVKMRLKRAKDKINKLFRQKRKK
jgi:RNA polymerase sigma-70 factor (ECF subfamily)